MPTDDTAVIQKTKDLCQAIREQRDRTSIRARIDAFMADDSARTQYDHWLTQAGALERQQQQAAPISPSAIAEFETRREAMLANPVTVAFLDARKELHRIQHTVNQYISKTLELGRVATEQDFASECCSHDCGCHG
jgi:cell fate (sporulation/competence/biofilm development) regulator YlbF (YheA/YmcA/DUF963 family)